MYSITFEPYFSPIDLHIIPPRGSNQKSADHSWGGGGVEGNVINSEDGERGGSSTVQAVRQRRAKRAYCAAPLIVRLQTGGLLFSAPERHVVR